MKFIAIIISTIFSISASAQSDMYIECGDSPKEAVLALPKPADKFARISCTKFGHIIQPKEHWIWTKPGGFNPVFYPAQMVARNPKQTNNQSYFKKVVVTELSEEEAKEKWSFVGIGFDKGPNKVIRSFSISAENNSGEKHTIYFFNNSWGYSCSPTCKKEMSFIVLNKFKEKVVW